MLGPLLFILFINDLPLHIEFCELGLYADDATMPASSSSLSTLLNFMTADFSNSLNWCIDNDMTLNLTKTIARFQLGLNRTSAESGLTLLLLP